MESKQILNYNYIKGVKQVNPANEMIKHWSFTEDTEDEAILANALAIVGQKNGLTTNDLQHIFPLVLRMLKNNSRWSI